MTNNNLPLGLTNNNLSNKVTNNNLLGAVMKNIVGQAVRNQNFWGRTYELEDIWEAIDSGSHILLCAPRRVGKTSIMYRLLDEPKNDYIPIYIDTESADSQAEFWVKIFNALMEEEFINGLKTKANNFWDKIKNINITSISVDGVEFGDGEVLDYKLAFERLIKGLDHDKKLIIMIDEFAQTIENVIKYEDNKSAISLLKAHRELRQNSQFSQKVTFIYAGSIGLESVVSKIDAIKHINDLNNIKVPPLLPEDAKSFAGKLFLSMDVTVSNDAIDYLLKEIDWLIPFYLQLIIQEIKKLYRRKPLVNNAVIDQAIHNALDNRNHFESWQTKLRTGLDSSDYLFSKEVLNSISTNKFLKSLDISDIANKHTLDDDKAKECIRSLVYDGYINNNDDVTTYKFNSPILRMWWNKNVAN